MHLSLGRAAYYNPEEADRPIYEIDRPLWEILHQRNNTITMKTTFNDVYYASIQEVRDSILNGNRKIIYRQATLL